MLNFKLVHSPFVFGIDFSNNTNESLNEDFICFYQSHVSTHMWAYVCICPDLGFAVSTLIKFLSNLILKYMIAI